MCTLWKFSYKNSYRLKLTEWGRKISKRSDKSRDNKSIACDLHGSYPLVVFSVLRLMTCRLRANTKDAGTAYKCGPEFAHELIAFSKCVPEGAMAEIKVLTCNLIWVDFLITYTSTLSYTVLYVSNQDIIIHSYSYQINLTIYIQCFYSSKDWKKQTLVVSTFLNLLKIPVWVEVISVSLTVSAAKWTARCRWSAQWQKQTRLEAGEVGLQCRRKVLDMKYVIDIS